MSVIIRTCQIEEIIDLRHRILRYGLGRSEAIFAGDELPSNFHFGAFDEDEAVGCATFHLNQWENEPAWQLRGMATGEKVRGTGVGKRLLGFGLAAVYGRSPIMWFWCNARVPAIPFYLRMGWKIASDEFDIVTAGPHRKMTWNIFDGPPESES